MGIFDLLLNALSWMLILPLRLLIVLTDWCQHHIRRTTLPCPFCGTRWHAHKTWEHDAIDRCLKLWYCRRCGRAWRENHVTSK